MGASAKWGVGCFMLSVGSGLSAPWLKKKINRAQSVILDWLNKCDRNVYLSISGGKDSLVAASLVLSVYPECPLVWINQGHLAEWEDCVELLYFLRDKKDWNIIELCPTRGLLQLYQEYGIPLEGTMNTKVDKLINKRLMYDVFDEYQETNAIQGYAWGLRKESKGRTMYLKCHGELYQRKDNDLWICSPVGYWKTEEIWQYIDSQKLPYASIYDRDRMTIRNGCPIGTTGVNWGRIADLKINHPSLYQEFCFYFPEMKNYG